MIQLLSHWCQSSPNQRKFTDENVGGGGKLYAVARPKAAQRLALSAFRFCKQLPTSNRTTTERMFQLSWQLCSALAQTPHKQHKAWWKSSRGWKTTENAAGRTIALGNQPTVSSTVSSVSLRWSGRRRCDKSSGGLNYKNFIITPIPANKHFARNNAWIVCSEPICSWGFGGDQCEWGMYIVKSKE